MAVGRYLATTAQGVERELALDLEDLGAFSVVRDVGKCFFEADAAGALRVVHGSRVANKVVRVLAEGEVETLADVRRVAASVDWPRVFPRERAFAVRAMRLGEHAFTSLEAEANVGDVVIRSFESAGFPRPRVRLNGPEVEVRVIVRDRSCVVGVNLVGVSLHKRGWRVRGHAAPLKPTLAAALLRFAGFDRAGFPSLHDPVTGSGTIPIEAALMARRIPPGRFRTRTLRAGSREPGAPGREAPDALSGNAAGRVAAGLPAAPDSAERAWFEKTHLPSGYLFQHLLEFGPEVFDEARVRLEAEARDAFTTPIAGSDLFERELDGARLNAEEAGVSDSVTFSYADVLGLDPDPAPRFLVANPPYGVRLGSVAVVDRVNRALASLLDRLATKGPVTAAFVSGDRGLERTIGHEAAESRRVLYGRVPVRFLRYEL